MSERPIIKTEDDGGVVVVDVTSGGAPEEDDTDDDDDEIVREIDVFVSPQLSQQLYLIQFPLQHTTPDLPVTAKLKPKHNMIELEQALPANIIANDPSGGGAFGHTMTKRTHFSQTIPIATHLALGKFTEDGEAMHIIPLQHIHQMRPDFSHVDEADPNYEDPHLHHANEKKDDTMEKKPLLYQKKESERAAMARKSSYAYKRASEDAEEWQHLKVCGPLSEERTKAESQILCENTTQSVDIIPNITSKKYVQSLNYLPPTAMEILQQVTIIDNDKDDENDDKMEISTDNVPSDDVPSNTPSTSDQQQQEKKMVLIKLIQRLTAMMHRGVPVSYSVLRPQFTTSPDDVLWTALSTCTVLVRGNFYLQSRLLGWLPERSRARTLILYLLETEGQVQRIGLEALYKAPSNSIVSSDWLELMLKQVALKTTQRCWKPRISDYAEIYAAYPQETALHLDYWQRQRVSLAKELKIYRKNIF